MSDITTRIEEMLLGEAAVKLTPLGKSVIPHQDAWTKEEIDSVISKMDTNAGDKMKYEVSLDRKANKKTLTIYRRSDDLVKRKMDKEGIEAFKQEVTGLIKGTGLKVVGDGKSADWVSVIVTA